jgi:phage baseplate assembly protein W|tara:strand:+ start:3830 stop:4273 length:444 start_codon:yes stop_codon:yes gene_type:complete
MASSIQGLSPSLPLRVDEVDGPYALNKTIKEMAKQNLRVLFFTVPGERIWNRNFGVGLRRYLFEQNTAALERAIKVRISNQVKAYLPYIKISSLEFFSARNRPDMSENGLIIRFTYVISPYNVADTIFINSDGPIEGIPSSQLLNVP